MYNVTMILAIDKNNLVGKKDGRFGLAWHYPEDLQFYKQNTVKKINVMGRNTFELIGKPLPNRQTCVLTRNKEYQCQDVKIVNTVKEVLDLSLKQEVMICGGVSVYETFNKYASKIILTRIDAEHQGDVYYNTLDMTSFVLTSTEKSGILEFQTWERNENR